MDKKEKNRLEKKREEVLTAIGPRCRAFGITDFDYQIDELGREFLLVEGDKIGCSSNSIAAIIDELIGWLFIRVWCKNRSLGAFAPQSKKQVKRYWQE